MYLTVGTFLSSVASTTGGVTYNFTDKGITWPNEYKKYKEAGYDSPSDVSPPPNWAAQYPNGYTEFPNLREDEHFQVWMRTAGLPTFRKLWFRNDNEVMQAGTYSINIYMSSSCAVLYSIGDGRWLSSF